MNKKERIAVIPGSFDPPTWGHYEIIHFACYLYDKVHVVIAKNPKKTPWMQVADRLRIMSEDMAECHDEQVVVATWDGAIIDYCEKVGANVILRSFRNSIDVEYEQTIAHINRKINPLIQTLYLSMPPETSMISSSAVRELFDIGYYDTAEELVPGRVADYLKKRK